ncbi:MAG TPA: NAD-dependent epimerase/dehydratase family protein [Burkholderiaceae bacterium]|nr:NAD-dependent epimerase/dehydratase family protein [Burkholderiaceae bacterium]
MKQSKGRPAGRTAVVAGASGLVGRAVLRRLLRQPAYQSIVALTRRPLGLDSRVREVPAHFDNLGNVLASVARTAVVDAYCCLGTTMKAAGSQAAFRRVDHDYVLAFGKWAAERGAHRLIVVSALGAAAGSPVLYNRVKGETEDALRGLRIPLVLTRPSLLDGPRTEHRPGEALALALTRPLRRLLPAKIRPVSVEDVAQSMIDAALSSQPEPLVTSAAMQGAAARADQRSA